MIKIHINRPLSHNDLIKFQQGTRSWDNMSTTIKVLNLMLLVSHIKKVCNFHLQMKKKHVVGEF